MRLVFVPLIILCVLDKRWKTALGLFIAAGLSDGLDGLAARLLNQRTVLGQYLDPIADKLLLSSLFLVLSIEHKIAWRYTVLVFSRDVCIVLITAILYMVVNYRQFRPSIYGKINTVAQIAALFFVLLFQVDNAPWIYWTRRGFLWATMFFTLLSGIHYAVLTSRQVRQWQARVNAAQ